MNSLNWVPLDSETPSKRERENRDFFYNFIIGQNRPVDRLCECLTMHQHALNDPEKPAAVLLFAGPSGTGKTETAKTLAKRLFGTPSGLLRIDCSTFQEEHSISRLIGPPPGYVGFDSEPEITQEKLDMPGFYTYGPKMTLEDKKMVEKISLEIINLDKEKTLLLNELAKFDKENKPDDEETDDPRINEIEDKLFNIEIKKEPLHEELNELKAKYAYRPGIYPSILLLDEIEKMHPKILTMLLPMFDFGEVKNAKNKTISFKNTFIIMTSNIGKDEIAAELAGKGTIGIKMDTEKKEDLNTKIYRIVIHAIETNRGFPPELLGRIGKEDLLVYQPLSEKTLRKIIDQKLTEKLTRVGKNLFLRVKTMPEVRDLIYKESQEGMSKIHGARPIAKIIETKIIRRLSNLIIKGHDGGVVSFDILKIKTEKNEKGKDRIVFEKAANLNKIDVIEP